MSYETKEGFGALFNNATNKKSDKHPDYTGNAMIGGKLKSVGVISFREPFFLLPRGDRIESKIYASLVIIFSKVI